jgi:mRNA-degrading endonuclease RelE of RelBE toxin-antitoxin system
LNAAGTLMKYKITISEQARRELRQLPKELRRNISYRIELMSEDLRGDVKTL